MEKMEKLTQGHFGDEGESLANKHFRDYDV
jgi:hypothetical protein